MSTGVSIAAGVMVAAVQPHHVRHRAQLAVEPAAEPARRRTRRAARGIYLRPAHDMAAT